MTEFEKMVRAIFVRITCACHSCESCKEVLGLGQEDECPAYNYDDIDKTKLWEFANKIFNSVMEKIALEEDLPFPRDLDEEDVIKIIMEMQ